MSRRHGIGGSDVAAILGLDPRKTPYQLWREKLGMDNGFAGSAATRRGNFLEPAILARYATEVHPVTLSVGEERTVDGWRTAHIDGLAIMPDGQRRVVEAKSVSRHVFRSGDWGAPWSDEVPDRVLCQGLWYASLIGADVIDVPVCVLPDDPDEVIGLSAAELMEVAEFHIYRAVPVAGVVSHLVERASAFWRDHVLAKVPPPPVTQDDVDLRWPGHVAGKVKAADPEVVRLLARYAHAGEMEREASAERGKLRTQIMAFAEDAEAIVGPDGVPWLTLKTQERKEYTVAAGSSRALRLTKHWNAMTKEDPT